MIYIDVETRSTLDLKKVGLYNYAPAATVICTAIARDNGPVEIHDGLPLEEIADGAILVAHNAGFEREILRAAGLDVPWELWIDTAAVAASMSLPRKLEDLAQALRLPVGKDMAGHRTMLKLSRPRGGWDDDEFWEEEERPADFATLREYCRQDVEVMRECYRRMLPLTAQEARLFALTGRMNDRGVPVDRASLAPAQAVLKAATGAGEARFRALTGGHGLKSYARAAPALGVPDLRKPTVRRVLRDPTTTPRVKEALGLFQALAKSSPAKLAAMEKRASPDGRCRGMLVYAGAERTGRWSGAGVQPQNFPRGLGTGTDAAFAALRAGALELLYDEPVGTVAEMLRGFFTGPLLVGDFAQIEARVLAWLAGQDDLIADFASHGDPYKKMAARIYGKDPKEITKDERFMGKQTILGCGYGMGAEKFRNALSDIYDVEVSVPFAERVITTYRNTNRKITALWSRLNDAVRYVVRFKKAVVVLKGPAMAAGMDEIGGLHYLWIQLPSGRRLYYCEPEDTAEGLKYWGRNIYTGGRWERVHTYGGKLAENVTQALSRDLMAEAMLRLEAAGFRLLLTVHDEIVAEDNGLLPTFKDVMLAPPSWADGLPIDADVFRCERYRK